MSKFQLNQRILYCTHRGEIPGVIVKVFDEIFHDKGSMYDIDLDYPIKGMYGEEKQKEIITIDSELKPE